MKRGNDTIEFRLKQNRDDFEYQSKSTHSVLSLDSPLIRPSPHSWIARVARTAAFPSPSRHLPVSRFEASTGCLQVCTVRNERGIDGTGLFKARQLSFRLVRVCNAQHEGTLSIHTRIQCLPHRNLHSRAAIRSDRVRALLVLIARTEVPRDHGNAQHVTATSSSASHQRIVPVPFFVPST